MFKSFFRTVSHLIFRPRQFNYKCIAKLVHETRNKKIMELGSGKLNKGNYYYSVKDIFDASNQFIQSDIKKEYGHRIVDATSMKFENEFDMVLCMNLLEHVYDFQMVIDNIYDALTKNGLVVILVPAFYPLHDEPHDYWRFTEHSLRKLLHCFSVTKLEYSGIRQYPFAYYVEAVKDQKNCR